MTSSTLPADRDRDAVPERYPEGKTMKSLALAFALMTSATAPALASQDLAQKKNCLSCHAVNVKRVGPAYKDVAAKYADAKDAVAVLSAKVIKGGSGSWGVVPMPANPQVSEAEAKALVQWILSLK
jgi:cytochrome c